MDYYIDLIMDGKFPNAPDHDKYIVTERVYFEIRNLLKFHHSFEGSACNGE